MKKIAVNKKDKEKEIRRLTANMAAANWFINVQVKPHKDSSKVWIVIG